MSKAKVVQSQILYGKPQELTSMITHAIGAASGLVGLVFLMLKTIRLGTAPLGVFSILLFGIITVLVLVSSALHHTLAPESRVRAALFGIDMASVALLVLAVFAPVMLIGMLRGSAVDAVWGYTLFAVIAATAIASAALCTVDRSKFKVATLILYIALGAACVMRADRVWELCGSECFWFVLGGCAAYAIGLAFYFMRKVTFGHALFHIFVLIGAVLNFIGVYIYLL